MAVTKSSNSENTTHINIIQDSFNIEANVMETNDSMAWECKLFTHEFIVFIDTENEEMKLKSNKSYMEVTTSSKSYNIPHTNMV